MQRAIKEFGLSIKPLRTWGLLGPERPAAVDPGLLPGMAVRVAAPRGWPAARARWWLHEGGDRAAGAGVSEGSGVRRGGGVAVAIVAMKNALCRCLAPGQGAPPSGEGTASGCPSRTPPPRAPHTPVPVGVPVDAALAAAAAAGAAAGPVVAAPRGDADGTRRQAALQKAPGAI